MEEGSWPVLVLLTQPPLLWGLLGVAGSLDSDREKGPANKSLSILISTREVTGRRKKGEIAKCQCFLYIDFFQLECNMGLHATVYCLQRLKEKQSFDPALGSRN